MHSITEQGTTRQSNSNNVIIATRSCVHYANKAYHKVFKAPQWFLMLGSTPHKIKRAKGGGFGKRVTSPKCTQ